MAESAEEESNLGPFFVDEETDSETDSEIEEPPVQLANICALCRQGHHDECVNFWTDAELAFQNGTPIVWTECCCSGNFDLTTFFTKDTLGTALTGARSYVDPNSADADRKPSAYFEGFNGTKDPNDYRDANSTGRKAAAKIAKITPGMVCEWAWLQSAGGGVIPIIGCPGRPASDRHHGPDKNTLHNALGVNLHRVCDWCHGQWHAKNDKFYGPRATREDGTIDASVPFTPLAGMPNHPHDAITRASDEDVYREDSLRREEARKHGAKI